MFDLLMKVGLKTLSLPDEAVCLQIKAQVDWEKSMKGTKILSGLYCHLSSSSSGSSSSSSSSSRSRIIISRRRRRRRKRKRRRRR
jgi:hypothetical protein